MKVWLLCRSRECSAVLTDGQADQRAGGTSLGHWCSSVCEAVLPGTILAGAYPNPFNPRTTIRFTVGQADHIAILVYDAAVRQVAVLEDRFFFYRYAGGQLGRERYSAQCCCFRPLLCEDAKRQRFTAEKGDAGQMKDFDNPARFICRAGFRGLGGGFGKNLPQAFIL